MLIKKWLITLFFLFALTGCEQSTNDINLDFEVAIYTADKFGVNETNFTQADPITITLTIKNISPETKTLSFPSSKQHDFVMYNDAGAEIWRWSNDMAFTTAITSFTLTPGESQTFDYTWDQTINGTLIPAGNYILEGQIPGISISAQQTLNIL